MLVVFDLDGTLIDSRRDLADAANALIAEYGGAPLETDRIAAMVGEGAATLVRRALTAAGIERVSSGLVLERFLALYDERLLAHTRLYDGIDRVLSELGRDYQLAVLTNKPVGAAHTILAGLGVAGAFQWVLGGDGPHARKPDPAGLQQIARHAGVDVGDAVLVGDSGIDLATARAAGCRICLAKYGFGFRSDLPLRGDEFLAETPGDIPGLLQLHR